jgi:RNAse (barnase) inhibitor barstar
VSVDIIELVLSYHSVCTSGGVLASLDKLMTIELVVQKLSAQKGLLQRKSQAVFTVMVSARERLEGLTRELFRFDS